LTTYTKEEVLRDISDITSDTLDKLRKHNVNSVWRRCYS